MKRRGFKDGAASFYVVAFSTLILVIIAASFATAIIAAITKSSNNDLSQSAYDAALAGVEDSKLAFMNYQNCIKGGKSYTDALSGGPDISCQDIVYWMKHPDCDMVGHILGRIAKDETGEVMVEEKSSTNGGATNNMNQAYTCALIQTNLSDYVANLSSSVPYRVINVNLNDVSAKQIKAVKVNWYSGNDDTTNIYNNLIKTGTDAYRVAFQPLTESEAAAPPTIAVQLLQTAENFTLEQINSVSINGATDRATVYLVPTDIKAAASKTDEKSYVGIYDGTDNSLTAAQFASTNDHAKDLPYAVYCPEDTTDEYVCSATLELPSPIGGERSDETFMFVVSLPYGQPDTDFSLEFICTDGGECGDRMIIDGGGQESSVAMISNMQVLIDSTGRANDLYRRVEVRMESEDKSFTYPFYAIQLLGKDGDGNSLIKNLTVTKEYGL